MFKAVLDKIRQSIEADADLQSWCQNHFGKAPSFVVGVDDSNPPAQTDYPVISLVGTESRRSTGEKDMTLSLFFGLGIVHEQTDGHIYLGTLLIERFRELFENAVFSANLGGKKTVVGESGEMLYPLFVGYVELAIAAPKSFLSAMEKI